MLSPLSFAPASFRDVIGFGVHGLCRLLLSDHNDGLLSQLGVCQLLLPRPRSFASSAAPLPVAHRLLPCAGIKNITIPTTKGESVMNSAMAVEVLHQYAQLLQVLGSPAASVKAVTDVRSSILQALGRSAWNGTAGHYRRVWLGEGPGLGWLGDAGLWLEPNAWAMLSGAADALNATQTVGWRVVVERKREEGKSAPWLEQPAPGRHKKTATGVLMFFFLVLFLCCFLAPQVHDNIQRHNRDPSPIGAIFSTEPVLHGKAYGDVWCAGVRGPAGRAD